MQQPLTLARALGTVALLALTLTACVQDPDVKKQRYMARGENYYSAGKHNEAIIELKNALQIDPKFVPAIHLLGRSYAAKSWYADAGREFQRAAELQPNDLGIQADLGHVYVAIEDWRNAELVGEMIREREPTNVWGLYLVGIARLGRDDPKGALDLLGQASAQAASTPAVSVAHGHALARLGRLDEADQAYRRALMANPKDTNALLGLGSLLLRQNRRDDAADVIRQARTAEAQNPKVRLAMSSILAAQGKLPDAIKELEELPRPSWSPRVVLALGELYVNAQRYDAAVELLRPVVQRSPDAPGPRHLLGYAFLGLNQLEPAISEFETVVRLVPKHPLPRYSLGLAYLGRGRSQDALRELQAVSKTMEKVPDYHLAVGRANFLLGRWEDAIKAARTAATLAPTSPQPPNLLGAIAVARRDLKTAQEMYARSLELDPGFVSGRIALGRVYGLDKKPEDALREYETVLKARPDEYVAIAAKTATLVQDKRMGEAVSFVESVAKAQPKNGRILTLLGNLYLTSGNLAKAEYQYRSALKLDDNTLPAHLGLARVLMASNKGADAIPHLQRILKDRPGDFAVAMMLKDLYVRSGQIEHGVAVVEAAARAASPTPEVSLALADVYVGAGRYDDAIRSLGPLVTADTRLVPARLLIGQAYLGKYDSLQALAQFEELKRLNPDLAAAHFYLGRTYAIRGDLPSAQKSYARALQLDPKLTRAQIELATVSGQPRDEEALGARVEELRASLQKEPGNIPLRYALALALVARKQTEEAEAELKRILEVAPGFAPANYLKARLLFQAKRPDEAAEYLRAVLRTNPSSIEANLALATYHEAKGNLQQAVGNLEVVLRSNPTLAGPKLRLAALYGRLGRVQEGIARAREVVLASPNAAGPRVVLGRLYLSRDETVPQAVGEFSKAVQLDARLPDAHLGLADAFARRGDIPKAAAKYRETIALAPKDPRAYNNLAYLYADRKQNLDEALDLARKGTELAPALGAVWDTLGWVAHQRGDYSTAEQALRKAVDLTPNNGTIHYHLGITYYRLGRKEVAAPALRRALQLEPNLVAAPEIRDVLKEIDPAP